MARGKTLFLGVEGSGKTTLAMALVRAFAKHAGEGWYLRPVDRGAFNFATIAPEDFAAGNFPRQTASAREMTWRIERENESLGNLEILDYPGEVYRLAFLNPDDEPNPEAVRTRIQSAEKELAVLRAAIADAERLFVLFNLQDALDLEKNDANRAALWVTNECLKSLKALPHKPQVTLVFTQVDRYRDMDGGQFLQRLTPRELPLVGHDHADVDWAMVSVMVPPDDAFGIDAFVRRCTGLGTFGVADGRPRKVLDAPVVLKTLEECREQASASLAKTAAPLSEGPASESSPVAETRRKGKGAWILFVFCLAFLAVSLGIAGRHVWRWRQVSAREDAAAAREIARLVAAAQETGPTTNVCAESENAPSVDEDAAVFAACAASLATIERQRSLEEALAKDSPQEAHDLLYRAAKAGHAEAQYRLAVVYDFWGWGGYVKTREEAKAPWTDWLRRIDLGEAKKAIVRSRPAKDAGNFRQMALKWYRAAASNGVEAASAALAAHGVREGN